MTDIAKQITFHGKVPRTLYKGKKLTIGNTVNRQDFDFEVLTTTSGHKLRIENLDFIVKDNRLLITNSSKLNINDKLLKEIRFDIDNKHSISLFDILVYWLSIGYDKDSRLTTYIELDYANLHCFVYRLTSKNGDLKLSIEFSQV